MAALVARPPQALRQRQRPSLATRNTSRAGAEDGEQLKSNFAEPYVRTCDHILKKFAGKPPSLTVHLHPTHFCLNDQDQSWAYNSPMRVVIDHLRKRTVPHELVKELLEGNIPFYDGE